MIQHSPEEDDMSPRSSERTRRVSTTRCPVIFGRISGTTRRIPILADTGAENNFAPEAEIEELKSAAPSSVVFAPSPVSMDIFGPTFALV
eukprot:CAMPEP_0170198706 /NCGR_PEP_ID=MMETSP0040_2-20121228/68931_1 /TAXON_ID=641309 /ORGANISM="Lotharella oceanica, Strain CCMP622" /LENGTH=89 /DNA_ID=CAMNT_0010448743 /DNA_START=618 /DNA_END=887 /DNA_ORIENTATION=+